MRVEGSRESVSEEKLRRYRESLSAAHQAFLRLPVFDSVEVERLHRKQRLAGAFRLFAKFGFGEGVAGHITARDPEYADRFWVNPLAMHFGRIRVSDLLLVDGDGRVLEGAYPVNPAAFGIHSEIHRARPDVVAVAHAHSVYGRAWSTLGRLLDPITQDACAFYGDHVLSGDYDGAPVSADEGQLLASALGSCKAAILRNHGLLTVGQSVEACVWWFVAMERCCQIQLLAEAAGSPHRVPDEVAEDTFRIQGNAGIGWFNFLPLWNMISGEQPDLFE